MWAKTSTETLVSTSMWYSIGRLSDRSGTSRFPPLHNSIAVIFQRRDEVCFHFTEVKLLISSVKRTRVIARIIISLNAFDSFMGTVWSTGVPILQMLLGRWCNSLLILLTLFVMYFAIVFNNLPIIILIAVADGVVNILRAGLRRIRDSTPGRGKKISFLLTVCISSEDYPVFYSMGIGSKSAAVRNWPITSF